MTVKQVIVIRKDLNMRRGKEIAQGSHVSMGFLISRLCLYISNVIVPANLFSSWELEWMEGDFTKIVCQIQGEEALLNLYNELKDKFACHLIQDKGLTEFRQPTYTALAIGPYYSHLLDEWVGPNGKYPLKLY